MIPQVMPQAGLNPLAHKDYTLIIDKSGSMSVSDMENNQTRWRATEESTFALAAKVFEFDPDGIDIWLFSSENKCYRNVRPEKVMQIFQENEPMGGTAMAEVLKNALDDYFLKRDTGKVKANGEMILVITDGAPNSQIDVINLLVNTALRLRPSDNLAVNFIQVGHDASATQFLTSLDNDLVRRGAPCDFVKTIKMGTIENKGLKQMLLDTITDAARARMTAIGRSI